MSKWKAIKKERNENTQKYVATKETITLNISETPQHALTHIILFDLKQLIRLTLNST